MKLPPQLFNGSRPRPGRLKPAGQRLTHPKPAGGIWTSTLVDGSSAWEEWCRSEAFRVEHLTPRYVLEPVEARVWVLQETEDVFRLFERYGRPAIPEWEERRSEVPSMLPEELYDVFREELEARRLIDFQTLRWEEFAEEWDALWLTDPYLDIFGMPLRLMSMLFYGWDCESTWWARWSFDRVAELH